MSDYREPARRPQQGPRRPQQGARRPQQGTRRPPQGARRRRKKSNAGFVAFLVVIALVAVAAGVLVYALQNRGQGDATVATPAVTPAALATEVTPAPADTENTPAAAADSASPSNSDLSALLGSEDAVITGLSQEQMVQVTDLSINENLPSEWMNVLLLGSDARTKEESSRTDTMIICSINTNTGEVKLTSMMRDTAIDFTNLGQYNGTYRLNAANFFGGPKLVMQTLNERLNLNIQYYAMVDFTTFSIVAEKLGGIDIDVSEAEMEQINKNAAQQYSLAKKAGIDESELEATNVLLEQSGQNVHLNGRQVVAYARIRKLDSDSQRTERQRKVLVALLGKIRQLNPTQMVEIGTTLFQYVSTNIDMNTAITVATKVLGSDMSEVPQLRLPEKDTYVQDTREGQAMLYDTNWDANAAAIYSFIYE